MLGKMKLTMTGGKQMLISPGAIKFVALLPRGDQRTKNETMVWLTMPGSPVVLNAVVTEKFSMVAKLLPAEDKLQLRGKGGETITIPSSYVEAAVENDNDLTLIYTSLRGPHENIRLEVLDTVESITDLLAPDEALPEESEIDTTPPGDE